MKYRIANPMTERPAAGSQYPRSIVLAWVVAVILGLVLAIAGCGGSGAGGSSQGLPPLPVFVPGSVSDADRDAAYTTVETLFHTVRGQGNAAAQIVAKMKTMKQFATAEVGASGDAIGWFTDGQMYAVFTSDPMPTLPSFRAPMPKVSRRAKPADLTNTPTAYLVNAFEPARADATPAIAADLTSRGYAVTMLPGKASDYEKISNAGLLFVHAHGLVSTDNLRVNRFWYATSEATTVQLNLEYKIYLDKGTVATGSGDVLQPDGTTVTEHHYIVSDEFLHESGMSFAQNATWISQACDSFNPTILNAVLDPSSGFPGVANYGGWTLPEDTNQSTPTSAFIFDRLLGINAVAPVDPSNPPPATFQQLRGLLLNTLRPSDGNPYDESLDPTGTAFFQMQSRAGSNVPTIMPVITGVQADSTAKTLTLSGYFGVDTGSIAIDDTPLAVHTWSETSVVVDLPTTPSGTLVATESGTLLSNGYQYSDLVLAMNPPGATLQPGGHQTFTVTATSGTLPAGVKYRWTVLGTGSIPGGSPFTTTTNSINYTAPNVDTVDGLQVEILDASNKAITKTGAAITVGNESITYTVTGDPTSQGIPGFVDGTLTDPFFKAYHVALSGHDDCLIIYLDPVTTNSFWLAILIPTNATLHVGDTFPYQTANGGFHFLPGSNHSNYVFNASNGQLTITSVVDNGNGTFKIGFSGFANDSAGCQIVANGSFIFHYTYDTAP